MYYYHPDYLGHVEYITDLDGVPLALSGAEVYQYFYYTAPMSRLPTSKPLAQRCFSADWSRPLARWGETLIEEKATRPGMHFESPYRFNDYGGKSFGEAFDEHSARSAELDEETGLYYYGARYYNPMVSVWLGVDPLAHKYPSLSSYVFTGNNPIMLVDPDGREIWIAGEDGSKILYTPGMNYEGDDEFTRKTVSAYNNAHAGSKTARNNIDNVVSSENKYTVQKGEKSKFSPKEVIDGKTGETISRGGTIYFNPDGGGVPVQAAKGSLTSKIEKGNGLMSLLHETIHASRYEDGKDNSSPFKNTGISIEELETTHTENIIRSEMGMLLRTHYQVGRFPDGTSTGKGTGFPLLKFKGGIGIISNYLLQSEGEIYKY
jgi:RHS repeat-associated protein